MFKGIIALFTSGLFFHPMVLSGIALAVAAMMNLQEAQIYAVLRTSYIYIGGVVWAFAYTFIFAKTYKEGSAEVDNFATVLRAISNSVRFLLAFVLTFSFAMMMSF